MGSLVSKLVERNTAAYCAIVQRLGGLRCANPPHALTGGSEWPRDAHHFALRRLSETMPPWAGPDSNCALNASPESR
jgi:hypothetical protein